MSNQIDPEALKAAMATTQVEKEKVEAIQEKLKEATIKEIDWPSADSKVKSIDSQLESAKGKKGYNPYLWAKNNNWERIKLGIKGRVVEAYNLLTQISNTIDCSIIDTGPLIYEESQFKPKK